MNNDTDERILSMRNSIDRIDEKLVALINQRLEFALDVGKAKAEKGIEVLDTSREVMVLQRIADLNKGPVSRGAIQQIFKQIMAASRELQTFHRVCYFGPEATFTHLAALSHFGHGVSFIPKMNIREVFAEVERGGCHFGVVPVENSIEGAVNHTLDLFFESDLKICAEKYQSISHDLLSKNGALSDIRIVYSHPQPFAQCRNWLEKYLPDAELRECGSTSQAAQKAAEDPGTAAIASSEASRMYGLKVIASRIEDIARNTTRFLVIGKEAARRTGNDKTSVLFVTSHVPGALYKTLKPIAENGINMVKLESRPTRHENWSYFFMADIEGHLEDEIIKQTLEDMRSICLYLKCLGSYPKGSEE
jgi:chorismate mutase/prephenate dehydratase